MQTAFLNDNDEADPRLEALRAYDILDTPAEPGFDDIVFLAAHACDAPVALISLVDRDRQWFKARVGFEPGETPIGQSVCAHALMEDDLLIIPDLTADARTRENPLVTSDPHLRFYAGAPLVTPDGTAIGSLCVIDKVPRPDGLTTVQARVLQSLGRQVIAQMELRRMVRLRDNAILRERRSRVSSTTRSFAAERELAILRASEAHSRGAEEAGGVGTFEADLDSRTATVSPEFCRLHGLPVQATVRLSSLEALIVADDIALLEFPDPDDAIHAVAEVEYRVRRADDGRLCWLARRSAGVSVPGSGNRLVGTVHDVTDRRVLQDHQAALLELGDRLRDLDDIDAIASVATGILARVLDVARTGYGCVEEARGVVMFAPGWTRPGGVQAIGVRNLDGYGPLLAELRRGDSIVVPDATADPRLRDGAMAQDFADDRALVIVPLVEQGRLGALLFVADDVARAWTAGEIGLVRAVADRTQAAVARIQAEKQQHLLNQELSHRLKNTFAMIQAIAGQTLRAVTERELVGEFERRMLALSSAHDVLVQQNWSAARIDAVVQNALDTFGKAGRFTVSGPPLLLHSRATLSLALILHELATNAYKYGALSVENGTVSLGWSLEEVEGRVPNLVLTWHERGGPPVRVPTRKGFGSRLIRMGLVGTGQVELRYEPSGLQVEMKAPLNQISDPTGLGARP